MTNDDVLKDMVENELPCFIAGGFVRDTYFNRPVSDIDIFILGDHSSVTTKNLTSHYRENLTSYYRHRLGSNLPHVEELGKAYYDSHLKVFKLTHPNFLYDMNLIFTNDTSIEDVLNRFPVAISQCAIQLSNPDVLITTEAFDEIKDDPCIRIHNSKQAKDPYICKLKKKYEITYLGGVT